MFVPKVDNSLDLSNIDRFFTREDAKETPTDESSILRKEKFEQFTYINENSFIPHSGINEEEDQQNSLDQYNDKQLSL